jgi:Tol biopolymer transport system component
MMMSKYRAGKWQDPQDARIIGSSKVNNWGGYSLNYDGSTIYFSSRRSNGVGGFDIWSSSLSDGEWSIPKNMGKPVNSPGNEGNPSVSPDGQRIYFMKCENMSTSNASGCKIYYSEQGPRGWQSPVALPEHINIGNTTSPRILPDNKTLVFTSDRSGGKGGVDIWLTKRTGDHWSEPVNLEVVNTADNDYFLTATMRSIAYYTTTNDKGEKVIAELRLPRKFRLENVIIRQGTIKDLEGNSLAADVRAYNLDDQTYEARMRTPAETGSFILILPSGAKYDVSYNEIRLKKLYQSELVDATDLIAPRREYPNIVLADLETGTTFPLRVLHFKENTAQIDQDLSSQELSRLTRLLKQYPALNVEIGAYQKEYIEDTVPSADLTELRLDTTVVYEPAIRTDTLTNEAKDSLLVLINQDLKISMQDTTLANIFIDRMLALDSVAVQKLISVYHNDRTPAQSEAVRERLTASGIDETRLQTVGYKDDNPPVEFPDDENRMIVIRFLNDPQD